MTGKQILYNGLAIFLLLSTAIAGVSEGADLNDGLVGYYSFDNCTAADDSGTGNNGSIVGNSQCVQGVLGSALKFGGVYNRGHVTVPNSPTLSFLDNYTFTVWFSIQDYLSMTGWGYASEYGSHTIIAKAGDRNGLDLRTSRATGDESLSLFTYSGWCCGRLPGGGGIWSTDKFNLDEWHMATFTSGNGEVRFYLDCKLQGSMPTEQFNVNPDMRYMPLQLGVDQSAWWYPINGILDEGRVYNRALSEDDIFELYNLSGFANCGPQNNPPAADAGPDQVLECTNPESTSVALDGSGSSDPDGDPLSYSWTWQDGSAEGVTANISLPMGSADITLTVDDGRGGTSSDSTSITVQDTKAPSTSVLLNGEQGNSGWYVSDVTVTLASTDNCTGVKEIHYTVNGAEKVVTGNGAEFTLSEDGVYEITYWSVDNAGNTGQGKTVEVRIDKTSPEANISVTPGLLWPPNRKMVNVAVNGGVNDPASGVASVEFTVTDEYGTVEPVISGFNTTISLEAWRNGNDKDGRHYTITAVITDNAGNVTTVTTEAVCPHDMSEKK